MNKLLLHPAAKPVLFLVALIPFARLLGGALADTLGPNPAEALIRGNGDWVLRMLCLTLAVTPLREWTGWSALARLRRMLGLFAFFYGVVHLSSYLAFDMFFDAGQIARDAGFLAIGYAFLAYSGLSRHRLPMARRVRIPKDQPRRL